MKQVALFVFFVVVIGFCTTGFQCSSAEMTSGRMYFNRSEWANAERSFEQEVSKNPNSAEGWYWLGRVRFELKNYKGMNEAFARSLAVSKEYEKDISNLRLASWGQLFNSGVEAYLKGRNAPEESTATHLSRAIEKLTTAIVIIPDSAATYRNLGLAYLALNDFEEAAKSFEMALQREKDPEFASSVGALYIDQGKKLQGEARNASGGKNEELQAEASRNFDRAIKLLEQARQWAPENTNIVSTLLDAYLAAGRTLEATNNFKLAVEKSPNNRLYRYNYGVLLLKAGDHKSAAEQFEAAVLLDPQFEDALYNLAIAYLQWGAKKRSDAEAASQKAGREKKIDRSFEEQFKKGRDALERLRDLKPNDADIWEALGQAYANLNMPKEASEAFGRADLARLLTSITSPVEVEKKLGKPDRTAETVYNEKNSIMYVYSAKRVTVYVAEGKVVGYQLTK